VTVILGKLVLFIIAIIVSHRVQRYKKFVILRAVCVLKVRKGGQKGFILSPSPAETPPALQMAKGALRLPRKKNTPVLRKFGLACFST
jgi:hypothetical protein